MYSPQLYIPSVEKIKLAKSRSDFEECHENIFVRFKTEHYENFDLCSMKHIREKTQQNYLEYLKQVYLFKLDNTDLTYPTNILYPDDKVDLREEPKTEIDNIILSGFVAHKNLRTVLFNYMTELENIKDKKRQRRLKHRQNKREKKGILTQTTE